MRSISKLLMFALILCGCSSSAPARKTSSSGTNAGASWPPEPWPPQHCRDVAEAVRRLANDQVHWDMSYVGLIAEISGKESELIDRCAPEATPLLLEALESPKQFVAAHVLLTYHYVHTRADPPGTWNHLHITETGEPRTDSSEQAQIQAFWKQRLGGT